MATMTKPAFQPFVPAAESRPEFTVRALILGAILFVCGALCMATKRNAIGVLIGVELVLITAFATISPHRERRARPRPQSWPAPS